MRRDSERGAALLTVLLLVAIISVIAATALERLRLSTRLATNAVALDAARGYAYAAETLATTRITALLRQQTDRVAMAQSWSDKPFGLPIPGGVATAKVRDGGNCFNLNSLVLASPDGTLIANPTTIQQFARLARLLRISNGEAIAAATADWIDSDDSASPNGAENEAYDGFRTAGTFMADVSELRAVKGVTPDAYAALRPWLCTLPSTARATINVNTLSPEQAPLLAMLLPDSLGIGQAQSLLLRRPPQGFNNTDPFWNQVSTGGGGTPPMDAKAQTGVKTEWFALTVDVTTNGAELHETGLIDARTLPVRLVSRQWGDVP